MQKTFYAKSLFVENFLSHSTEKIYWGKIRCIRKFRVSNFFCMKRGYHDFLSKIFCLTVPKNFVGEPFCVSKKFWYRKLPCIGGGHHGFVENFWSHRTQKLRKGFFLCFRNFLAWKKIMDKRWGVSQFSFGNFSFPSAKKFRRGIFQSHGIHGIHFTK